MQKEFTAAFVTLLAAATLSGCAAAPLNEPMRMGPVDAGAGSVEAVRRQLSGSWDLVSLTAFESPSGAPVPMKAAAVLTYDDYGNLTMKGRVEEGQASAAASALLDYSGRAVIDVASHQLRLQAVEGTGALQPQRAETFLTAVRTYAFEGDLLKISTINAEGNPTATTTWRRRTP
jgi:hypothetical protein